MAKMIRVEFTNPENNEIYSLEIPEDDFNKTDGDLELMNSYYEKAKELEYRKRAFALLVSENCCNSYGGESSEKQQCAKEPGAEIYVEELEKNLTQESDITEQETGRNKGFIWSSKIPTERDKEATHFLLNILCEENFKNKLTDKKTKKKQIFTEIYNMFLKKGLVVAHNVQEGQERIHQKWRNLERSFINFENNKKQTGAKRISEPPFYDLLNNILGDKHKVTPPKLLDSLNNNEENVSELSAQTSIEVALDVTSDSEAEPNSTEKNKTKAKMAKKKKTKQSSLEEINQTLINMDKKQDERFAKLENVLKDQNKERKRSNDIFELFVKKKFKIDT